MATTGKPQFAVQYATSLHASYAFKVHVTNVAHEDSVHTAGRYVEVNLVNACCKRNAPRAMQKYNLHYSMR